MLNVLVYMRQIQLSAARANTLPMPPEETHTRNEIATSELPFNAHHTQSRLVLLVNASSVRTVSGFDLPIAAIPAQLMLPPPKTAGVSNRSSIDSKK